MAERVYTMIVGFSGFGFPKAHGAAFGLLAYQSTWLRVHYGPEFLCALLNEQPMGFYASDTLVHEAQRQGDRADRARRQPVRRGVHGRRREGRIRLGLDYVLGARTDEVAALVAAREAGGPFRSLADLASRAGAGRAVARPARLGGRVRRAGRGRASERRRRGGRRARAGTALWRLGVAAPGTAVGDAGRSSRCRSSCPARPRSSRSPPGTRWSPTTRRPG